MSPPVETTEFRRPAPLYVALACAAAVVALVIWRTSPPPARAANAAPEVFSAVRARNELRLVLDGAPHPTGSSDNRRVAERLEARLRALGLEVERRETPVCSRYAACARVLNLLAKPPGQTGPFLLLSAHHDSVPVGAGVADDGMGIATLLEVARALALRPGPLPVLLLFTDGEEAGLLGAEAFVREDAARFPIAAMINVEARGTEGASLLFETTGASRSLIDAFGSAAPRPLTSSLFAAAYARLPNDTDLSILRRTGAPGVNFANVGGVGRYHTPRDDFEHLSLDSLQHHGDSVLGLARALGPRMDEAAPGIFFDVLGFGVVHLSRSTTRYLSFAALLLFFGSLVAGVARELRAGKLLTIVASGAGALVVAALVGQVLGWLWGVAGALPTPFVAHPSASLVALAGMGLVAGLAPLRFGASPTELWFGVWSLVGLVSLVVYTLLPEACFVFLVPWWLAALFAPFVVRHRNVVPFALIVPAVGLWVCCAPVARLGLQALGLALPAAFSVLAAFATLVGLPVAPGARAGAFRLARGALVVGLLAGAAQAVVPAFSPDSPRRSSVAAYWDASAKSARCLVDASSGSLPPSVAASLAFSPEVVDSWPTFVGFQAMAYSAPLPALELPAPTAEVLEDERNGDTRRVALRLRSQRGASTLRIHFPLSVRLDSVTWEGQRVVFVARSTHRSATWLGVPPDGLRLELRGTGDLSFVASDDSPGLPDAAQGPARARPAHATASQAGDETVVSAAIRL